MSFSPESLTTFLVEANASQGDDASVQQPLLNGSKQLEYRNGDYFYRDIYFGMAFFAGQETVEYEGALNGFHGKEVILLDGKKVYELRYSGGIVR